MVAQTVRQTGDKSILVLSVPLEILLLFMAAPKSRDILKGQWRKILSLVENLEHCISSFRCNSTHPDQWELSIVRVCTNFELLPKRSAWVKCKRDHFTIESGKNAAKYIYQQVSSVYLGHVDSCGDNLTFESQRHASKVLCTCCSFSNTLTTRDQAYTLHWSGGRFQSGISQLPREELVGHCSCHCIE